MKAGSRLAGLSMSALGRIADLERAKVTGYNSRFTYGAGWFLFLECV